MPTPAADATSQPAATARPQLDALDFRLWRLAAWAGPAYLLGVLGFFVVVAGFLPPPREYWTATQVAEFFRDNEVRIRIGMEGVILFSFFYLPWSLAITRVIERLEGPVRILSRVQLYGGLGTAFITMACGVVWLTASFRADVRAPGDIALMNDLAFMIFALTIVVTVFQVVAFGVTWLLAPGDLVPRWVGYLSLWSAVLVLPVYLIPTLQHGVFAWHGLVNFYIGLAAFGGWITVASWATLRAIARLQADQNR